jgi:protein-S-isoprenylcysteine O-methyltransferase Ste14
MWWLFFGWVPSQMSAASQELLPEFTREPPRIVRILAFWTFAAAGAAGLRTAYVLATNGDGTPLPLDTARRLVIAGPYRHVRNPMAMCSFVQGAMTAVMHGSVAVAVYVGAGVIVWQCVARPWEERDLAERFGEEYERYRAAVRCWVPRRTPWDGGQESAPRRVR